MKRSFLAHSVVVSVVMMTSCGEAIAPGGVSVDRPRYSATSSVPNGLTDEVFAPETFTRTTGEPLELERTVVVEITEYDGPFTIRVINGALDSEDHRITSAEIWLDGESIFRPEDFGKKVASLERGVELSTESTLRVRLAGKPGTFLTIGIEGTLKPGRVRIGPDGGVFSIADGKVVLDVPPNAMDKSVIISVNPVDGPAGAGLIAGTVFEFGPGETVFLAPVGLGITYDPTDLPATVNEDDLVVVHGLSNGRWTELESVVDPLADAVSTTTTEFSPFGVGPRTLTVEVTSEAVDMTVCATKKLTALAKFGSMEFPLRLAFWRSSDESVARVDAFGNVSALTAGMSTMTAQITDAMGSAEVLVTQNPYATSCDMVVNLDVSDLSYQSVTVSNVASFTEDVIALNLTPGLHSIVTNSPHVFTITEDGRFDFDPTLDAIFGGRGTTTLTLTGFPMRIDVSDLSYLFVTVSNVAVFHDDLISIRLTPGLHSVLAGNFHEFTITQDGLFDFDSGLDAIYSGRGSSVLMVTGFQTTIDATQHTIANFDIAAVGSYSAALAQVVSLTYGTHAFISSDANFNFTIEQPDGTIDYDESVDSQVSGRGTHLMTLVDPTVDSDGDGVADGIDICNNTLPNVPVGPNGCPDVIGTYVGTLRYRTFTGNPTQDIDMTFQGFTLDINDAPIFNGDRLANGTTSFPAGTPEFLVENGPGVNCLPLGDGLNGFTGNVVQRFASLGRCGSSQRWQCGDVDNEKVFFLSGRIIGSVCIIENPSNHGRFDFDVARQ